MSDTQERRLKEEKKEAVEFGKGADHADESGQVFFAKSSSLKHFPT